MFGKILWENLVALHCSGEPLIACETSVKETPLSHTLELDINESNSSVLRLSQIDFPLLK